MSNFDHDPEKLAREESYVTQQSHSFQAEKLGVDRIERESIAAAIEVGSTHSNNIETEHDLEKAHEPVQRVVTAQDWNGSDDPENPLNWPTWKKAYHTASTAFLGFAVTCGSSLITPGTPQIAEYFQVPRTASILSLSLFVLGLALGPTVAAPISETFGRSVVYKVSAPIYMLFILGSGFSKTFGGLLVCRLLAGMAGGPVLAVGAGTNADMFHPKVRALATSLFVMMPFLGPSLGPVVGGFAAQYKGWRWTQWCTIFIALASTAFMMPMQETYKKIILQRRAKRLNLVGPPTPPLKGLAWWKNLIIVTLGRPVHMLFTEPIVLCFSLYNAFTFSVLFAFFAAYPYTFESVYGFNTWQYGLTFIGIGVGVWCAVAIAMIVDRTWYQKHHRQALKEGRTAVAPEYRLLCAQIGSIGLPIG